MSITDFLFEKTGLEIKPEPTDSNYSMENTGGVELEVGEFLYGLIRMMKPENVLETGTHLGVGASYIGMALKDNGKGHLDTLEYLPEIQTQAEYRMKLLRLTNYVTCHLADALAFQPKTRYQLIFLDTEPGTRFREFLRYYSYLDEGGYIFIHDLGRHLQQIDIPGQDFAWPFGVLPEGIVNLIHKGFIKTFHFDTPRGLSGFYKVHKEDYK